MVQTRAVAISCKNKSLEKGSVTVTVFFLTPAIYPPVSLPFPGPKMALGHTFLAPERPQNWFGIRF